MIRVAVAGAAGRMGSIVAPFLAEAADVEVVARLDLGDDAEAALAAARPDVLVDFTLAAASRELAPAAARLGISPVVGVSGYSAEDTARLRAACLEGGVPGLLVPNFSIGAVLQMRHAAELAASLPCTLIAETHHPGKKDKPSGTALATARAIEASSGQHPPITSERIEGRVAEQLVRFEHPGERCELVHVVTDRRAYLPGVLLAVRRVAALPAGLTVGLDAVLR